MAAKEEKVRLTEEPHGLLAEMKEWMLLCELYAFGTFVLGIITGGALIFFLDMVI